MQLPPLPPWHAIHPLLVHFPIALLLTAPVLIAVGLIVRRAPGFRWAALTVLAMGTIAIFFAASTGEAGADVVDMSAFPAAGPELERHEELAEVAEIYFPIVTLAYAGLLAAQALWPKARQAVPHYAGHTVVLLALLGGALLLANIGHAGGQLVHQSGIHAVTGPTVVATGTAPAPPPPGREVGHD